MKNVAIYYRVSTDKQDLESQKLVVEKWLAELPEDRKPKKVKVFKDEGISGKTLNRPGLNAMLDAAYKRRFDTIIVYRLDRFSRSANSAIRMLLNLEEAGVGFVSVTQPVLNLGSDNPFRRTMLAAFAEIAELERETTVARVKAGLEAAEKAGVKLGRPPKATPAAKALAASLRAKGLSYRAIAKQLRLSVGTVHKLVAGE